MFGDLSLVDAAEQHAASRNLLDTAVHADARLCVTAQVLAEFFAIVTNPKRVSPARTPDDAARAIAALLSLDGITVIPVPETMPNLWIELLRERPVCFQGRIAPTADKYQAQPND